MTRVGDGLDSVVSHEKMETGNSGAPKAEPLRRSYLQSDLGERRR